MTNILDNIKIVLVGTLYCGNLGQVCRAMANMGLNNLALAAPNLDDDWVMAERFAVHAQDVLSGRIVFNSLQEAIADCAFVAGTTARGGLYRQHVKSPRELAPELLELASQGKVAIVFGREDKGLTNEEIACCTHLIRIPVDPGYESINLSQAVLLCAYELFTATGNYQPPTEKSEPAVSARKLQLSSMWREMLLEIGFMKEDKAAHMMQGIQRIFSRGVYSDDDVSIMMGVARQSKWAAKNSCADALPEQ
ncbi:MAG: RNA methyltransferase [Kiritimatiellae bacterium]|jgi:TrmH family RNA methyltransferase|nr:RNA methyltransferase [Kiritimatiellia bacterium]